MRDILLDGLEKLNTRYFISNKNAFLVVFDDDAWPFLDWANNRLPKAGGWSLDEVAYILTGKKNHWGYASEYSPCCQCDAFIERNSCWLNVKTGGVLCADCQKGYPDNYLKHLINNPNAANQFLPESILKERGFALLPNSEMSSSECSPKEHLEKLQPILKGQQFIFNVIGVDYLTTWWNVYARKKE